MRITRSPLVSLAVTLWASNAQAVPISTADAVTVNGVHWAQVDIFFGATWDQLNFRCPSGVCIAGSSLGGYNLTGWHWASQQEVADLFNYYIGSTELVPGDYHYEVQDSAWAPAFFADGWRHPGTFPTSDSINGWTSTSVVTTSLQGVTAVMTDQDTSWDIAGVQGTSSTDFSFYLRGAWLYTTQDLPPPPPPPPPPIPSPATLGLFGLALATLGWSRRKFGRPASGRTRLSQSRS